MILVGLIIHHYMQPKLKELHDWVGATSHNFLEYMGYSLDNHSLYFTETWVQEFSKKGDVITIHIFMVIIMYQHFII